MEMLMSIKTTGSLTLSMGQECAAPPLGRINGVLRNVLEAICAYRRRKANAAIMSTLDEHTLRDIGLTRFEAKCADARC
jgi:uncharacterized protein YjiS (DUF1127 family)